MKKFRKDYGITLIALVITVIILLILAGIAIASLTGENGLITRAQEARTKTDKAQEREGVEIAVASSRMEDVNTLEIKKESLENAIKDQFGENKDFLVTDNKDGSFLINMNDTKRVYYVDDTGIVIPDEKILKISTADELKAFRDDVNSGKTYEGWYVYLANNITLDINEEWEPIGYYDQNTDFKNLDTKINKPFRGIFDGNEYTIDGISINTTNMGQGIFGLVIDGTIKNVNLGKDSEFMSGIRSGGIVGVVYRSGKIINCKNYANINAYGGGIVGLVVGSVTIENCINYGTLTDCSGGICGASNGEDWEDFINVRPVIRNCGNYGNIEKSRETNNLGGISGYFRGNILNSFNEGTLKMISADNVGGIVGDLHGDIINCYNTGEIISQGQIVGGLVGTIIECENFSNNYNVATVTGVGEHVDILLGLNQCAVSLKNCYVKGDSFTASNLGEAFKDDTNNINNGYPILQWQ